MFSKDDPKSKWLHVVLMLVAALIIFKVGMLVGEFKIIKAMVVGGGPHQKMLFRGDDGMMGAGARFFHKSVAPGEKDMMWQQQAPTAGTGNMPPGTVPMP